MPPAEPPATPAPSTSPQTTPEPQMPFSTIAPVPTLIGSDRCQDATTLVVDGSATSVSNSESSQTQLTCGRTSYEGTVSWFSFVGTGRRVKISTCTDETAATIDTKIAVYSGTCDAPDWTCVAENDNDASRCPSKPESSTLFFNSNNQHRTTPPEPPQTDC